MDYMLNTLTVISAIGIFCWAHRFRFVRRLIGYVDILQGKPRKKVNERVIEFIYMRGTGKPKVQDETMIFGATWLVRGMAIVVFSLLMWVTVPTTPWDLLDLSNMLIMLAGALYVFAYSWMMRIELTGTDLRCRNFLLEMSDFDLTDLVGVEEGHAGTLRLEFADGRSSYIFKYVHGTNYLRRILVQTLEINTGRTEGAGSGLGQQAIRGLRVANALRDVLPI